MPMNMLVKDNKRIHPMLSSDASDAPDIPQIIPERAIKRNQCLENSENTLPLQSTLVAYETIQPPVNL